MGNKKVKDLIKGVVITGAAVSGASVLTDADLVYAQTTEMVDPNSAPELVVEVPAAAIAVTPAVSTPSVPAPATDVPTVDTPTVDAPTVDTPTVDTPTVDTPTVDTPTVDTPTVDIPTVDTPTINTPVVEPNITLLSTPAPVLAVAPVSAADSSEPASSLTDEQLSGSASESLASEESTLTSTSELQSTSFENTTNSLSNEIKDTNSAYNSESTSYVDAGYANSGLEELETEISQLMADEAAIRQSYIDNKVLDLSKNGQYYATDTLEGLAIDMIRHKLILEGNITADYTITSNGQLKGARNTFEWKAWRSNYYQNHYCIKYYDQNDDYHEEYYDYATCDEDGNSLIRAVNNGGFHEDNDARIVKGINILKKIPIYSDKNNGDYYQRTGFEVINGNVKGYDWYTMNQYLADVAERVNKAVEIASLSNTTNSLTSQLSDTIDQASQSATVSETIATSRSTSLSDSALASTSASEYKSESIADSLSASATQSEYAASVSASESASIATAESETAALAAAAGISTSASAGVTASTISVEVPPTYEATAHADISTTDDVRVATFTPVSLSEAQVPLAVINEDVDIEMETNGAVTIDTEEPPKAAIEATTSGWWFGTPGFIGAITGAVALNKEKKDEKNKSKK
ncbi:MAG: hypothetical protein K6F66_00755 [Pseudobutyrivibrio sp.]|nr:hypothetical protein [Pseudobutyrivibrio sp.]